MNRVTSRVTYKDILTNGKADTQRKHILKLLATGESLSRREIASVVMIETSSVSGRINELIKQGILTEDIKRKCTISHRLVCPVRLSEV